jgi:hypothetical protein
MRSALLICLVSCGFLPSALAHHSFSAEFDANQPITITGTVTSVDWRNPHVWFYVDGQGDGGKLTSWG